MNTIVTKTSGKILSVSLYQIDVDQQKVEAVVINKVGPDLESYLDDLLAEIDSKDQKRAYEFESNGTEFHTSLSSIIQNKGFGGCTSDLKLSKRLLSKEIAADQKYGHLGTAGKGIVKKGSFLQFIYSDGGKMAYLGVKIEHQTFIDEEDFVKKIGLSVANKVYKACRVSIKDDEPDEVHVYDTNSKPAAYWWDSFLELKQTRNDAYNTKTAVTEVVKSISRFKKDFSSDYTILRNAVVAYFKKDSSINYDDFIKDIFGSYVPVDEGMVIKMPAYIKSLKELPTKKNFDTQFSLIPGEVPYRKTKYSLSKEIDLFVKDGIKNVEDKIWSEKTSDGRKLVVIESAEGYDNFVEKERTV